LADYDTLSASQVVRRLDGLGPEELAAVLRYESSHRRRRTILNRSTQLLEVAREPDGSPAEEEAPAESGPEAEPGTAAE